MGKRENIQQQLAKFIPQEFTEYVADLLFSSKVAFKVSKPRKTKLGDYRPPFKDDYHRISVNGNLNQYQFLITTLHEFAHMQTYLSHGWKVKAHGEEWKNHFKELLLPLLNSEHIPKDIKLALRNSITKLKASSCTDLALSRVLKRYDATNEIRLTVEELPFGAVFELNSKQFKKGKLRRKRFLCEEISSGKLYLVHCLAEIKKIEINEHK